MESFSESWISHPSAQRVFMGNAVSKSKEAWRMCGKSSTSTWPLVIRSFRQRLLMNTNALLPKRDFPYWPTVSKAWWPKKMEAFLAKGLDNSRSKDLYDLYI